MDKDIEKVNNFMLLLKGNLISIISTLIMILILSIILSVTEIKENVIMPVVIFISSFSILLGSFIISKKVNSKGIVYGAILGAIYMLTLYLISSIMNFNFSLNLNSIIMISLGLLGGAIGGSLGINLK